MSLDVYLKLEGHKSSGSGIYIRENGQTREVTRAEWNEKYPNREPVIAKADQNDSEVYSANITHNLGRMADEAGIYDVLWRPDENGIEIAYQVIEPLLIGLERLKADPAHFKQFNASNGWGVYENLVRFAENYLEACQAYPTARVYASR